MLDPSVGVCFLSDDEPLGDTPRVEYRWDAARVLEHYTNENRTKRVFIAVAVERASGRLVAINELLSSRAPPGEPDLPVGHPRATGASPD